MATTNSATGNQIVELGGSDGAVAAVASAVSLASLATSQQLLAANPARLGLLLTNTDANAARVKYGTTASATSFSAVIPSGAYWEMPRPIYLGRIDCIWDGDGSGSLVGSEL